MDNSSKFKKLASYASKLFNGDSLVSVSLVGSVARSEPSKCGSDVDLLIFIDNDIVNPRYFELADKFRRRAKNIFHAPISLQIITPIDLQTIIAPTLLPGYINDGVRIYGTDIKNKLQKQLAKYTPREKSLASFKRILFERYHFRKTLTKLKFSRRTATVKDEALASKRVVFIIKELTNITGLVPDKVLERLGLNDDTLELPVSPHYFKSKKYASTVSQLLDRLVLALKDYLRQDGPINLDVW